MHPVQVQVKGKALAARVRGQVCMVPGIMTRADKDGGAAVVCEGLRAEGPGQQRRGCGIRPLHRWQQEVRTRTRGGRARRKSGSRTGMTRRSSSGPWLAHLLGVVSRLL